MLPSPQLLLSALSLLATTAMASRLPHAADMSSSSSSQNPQLAAREPQPQPQPQQGEQGPAAPTPTICTETNSTNSNNSTTKTWAQVLSRFPPGSLSATTALPVPGLTVDFRLKVDLNPKIGLGEGPWGLRNWISFKGGEWSASWGGGTVEAGGQDAQLLTETKATYVDTRYLLVTDDEPTPAHIMVQTTGWRTGPPDVLERLLDPVEGDKVPASDYRFRLFIRLETGDPRYYWVNEGMWLGSGIRRGSEVIYDGYRVL